MSTDPASEPAIDRAPLTNAYRLLRHVAPPDSPFPGWLARTEAEETVLLVATADLDDWAGISAQTDGHVLAPRDLVRCVGGLRIELDWCPERLESLLDRRALVDARLRPGEAVTLAVSVRRGVEQLILANGRKADEAPRGQWWVTDAARPVFVHGHGPHADVDARSLLLRIAHACDDDRIAAAVRRHAEASSLRELADARIEAELFSLAEATVVETTTCAPRRARTLQIPPRASLAADHEPDRKRHGALWERHFDAELSALVSDALHRLVEKGRMMRKPTPWLVAAGIAGALIVGGLAWPAGKPAPAQAQGTHTTSATPSASSPAPVPVPSAAPATPVATTGATDLIRVTAALLDARSSCGDDVDCLADVVEDPSMAWMAAPVDLIGEEPTITLLDDFGGAAVLRVQARNTASSQLVVIVESDGRWLLRDVHDVAQQNG